MSISFLMILCNVILIYIAKIGTFLFFSYNLKMDFVFILQEIVLGLAFEIEFHFHF